MGQFKNKESISPALKDKTARSADLPRERGCEDIAAPYKYLDALGEGDFILGGEVSRLCRVVGNERGIVEGGIHIFEILLLLCKGAVRR